MKHDCYAKELSDFALYFERIRERNILVMFQSECCAEMVGSTVSHLESSKLDVDP
jgi:hypothetical protein